MSEKAKKVETPKSVESENVSAKAEAVSEKPEVVKDNVEKSDAQVEKKKEIDRKDQFRVGDTVKVFYRIIEGGKERTQPYEGTVITKKGSGISKTFTVRRIGMANIGVERIFPLYSPKISEIQVVRKGKARRAKLYYLRNAVSKRDAKIKERV